MTFFLVATALAWMPAADEGGNSLPPACIRDYQLPIGWWARPGESPYECGYYVGGGAARQGEPRRHDEGTWGWDYLGWIIPRSVRLNWFHGQRCQGGSGAYATDRER